MAYRNPGTSAMRPIFRPNRIDCWPYERIPVRKRIPPRWAGPLKCGPAPFFTDLAFPRSQVRNTRLTTEENRRRGISRSGPASCPLPWPSPQPTREGKREAPCIMGRSLRQRRSFQRSRSQLRLARIMLSWSRARLLLIVRLVGSSSRAVMKWLRAFMASPRRRYE